jgi:hypothetical protein
LGRGEDRSIDRSRQALLRAHTIILAPCYVRGIAVALDSWMRTASEFPRLGDDASGAGAGTARHAGAVGAT